MLRDQIAGKNNSWAVRWYASAFLANKLTLYPGHSLVRNIGLDNSGTHCDSSGNFNVDLTVEPVDFRDTQVQESLQAYEKISVFFRSIRPGLIKSIYTKLKDLIKIGKRY